MGTTLSVDEVKIILHAIESRHDSVVSFFKEKHGVGLDALLALCLERVRQLKYDGGL